MIDRSSLRSVAIGILEIILLLCNENKPHSTFFQVGYQRDISHYRFGLVPAAELLLAKIRVENRKEFKVEI
jgi:hypothetical protein